MEIKISDQHTKPMVRVFIMLVGLLTMLLISWNFTGSVLPQDPKYSLIFQNALLLIVLGSAILEHFFTKPADSMINSLMAGITMLGVFHTSPSLAWWIVFGYCLAVFVISSICVATSGNRLGNNTATVVNSRLYRPAVVLGRARVIFSVVFLFGLYSFYSIQSELTVALIIFWGVFMALWPLNIPQLLSVMRFRETVAITPIGQLLRIDNPGILRFSITQDSNWEKGSPLIYKQFDKTEKWILPLYSHLNQDSRVGTAMILGDLEEPTSNLSNGCVYKAEGELPNDKAMELLGENTNSVLLGFISEDSTIARIRLEVRNGASCSDGLLIWCRIDGVKVYY